MVLGFGSKSSSKNKAADEVSISASDVDQLSMKNLDTSEKSQFKEFKDFLKTVVSFTGDLSSLTCPAFFLNGLSLLEYGTYWVDHPSHFTAIGHAQLPQERLLAISRWFISTLYGSYASRCTNGQYEKKPYNPILGETFFCNMGDAKCVCEQVCHHPPISAFYFEDEKAGISLNGHSGQKSKFKGTSIKIEQVGRAVLYLKEFDEQYLIDFPDLLIRGVLTGGAYIELGGTCTIVGSNNTKAVIDFVPKPWFGGDYNHIKGTIYTDEKAYYHLSGRWSHQSFYSDTDSESSKKELLFDAEAEPMAERVTAPLEDQDEYESHRVWGPVTEALKEKNYKSANQEKTKIEDWQRGVRKERAENNENWEPKLFVFQKDADAESGTKYQQKSHSLKSIIGSKHHLDDGAWTYKDSLHIRQ
ncbi:Oxysterol-binding protein [Backusella circina FSU 941]|nr:Oxysterol-binding protein [Backusella circina FSU 941]